MVLKPSDRFRMLIPALACALTATFTAEAAQEHREGTPSEPPFHLERPDDAPPVLPREREVSPPGRSVHGPFVSVQVNVDANGMNIVGDAANEPSIAVDPTDHNRMAIGWRQFDTIYNNFRRAGVGYTRDGGQTWLYHDALDRNSFRSDPVLDFDSEGNFYYNSLLGGNPITCDVFRSTDGGATWSPPLFARGGDKAWMAIDRTGGIGHGNIYTAWNPDYGCCGLSSFSRLVYWGMPFETPTMIPERPKWGTISVGPGGEVYICGGFASSGMGVVRSSNIQDPDVPVPEFELVTRVEMGGFLVFGGPPNPGGLLGQPWVATDHSRTGLHGNVYFLASVNPPGPDPLDVMFARSTDGGETWSEPVRVNDDPVDSNAWQWFSTMSVAPNGRIDVIWNDTRNTGEAHLSELYYTYSTDGGAAWSTNVAASEVFNSTDGQPNQDKIGDYYDMISDNTGADLAYAATFNNGVGFEHEQDVYYLRIEEIDCNGNGVRDVEDVTGGTSLDCNDNLMPDECEPDCNGNGVADPCDVNAQTSPDCDGNFAPDECDPDFDGDGSIDACDPDTDDDGVANEDDRCPFTPLGVPVQADGQPLGDTNGNCVIGPIDYRRFRACLVEGGPEMPVGLMGCLDLFDSDTDTDLDLFDFSRFQTVFGLE